MARLYLLNRLLGVATFCALLSLMWFNAGSAERYLKTYNSSKQAKQSAAASILAGNKQTQPTSIFDEPVDLNARPSNVLVPSGGVSDVQPDVDAQPDSVITPSTSTSSEQVAVDPQKDMVTTPSISTPDKGPDIDAQSHNATTPLTSSPSPFPPLPPADDEEYMSICMAVKNQSVDLAEFFLHHYSHLGIRRFYIFDDGTEPPLSTASYPIPSSTITWVYFEPHVQSDVLGERKSIQEKYYTACVNMFGDRHTWMGFLDADEFLEMTGGETLSDFLHEWGKNDTVGAVGVNWLVHSSAGLLTRPKDGPRKAFNRCIVDDVKNDNLKVKTFVRTASFDFMWNCHCMATLKNGAIQVGEDGDLITEDCNRQPITRKRWGLHHYGPKSKEEFLQKQERGKIRGGKAPEFWWNQIEDAEQRDCFELTKYVP